MNIDARNAKWLPLVCTPTRNQISNPGTYPDWNGTGDLLLCRTTPHHLSHTGQGNPWIFFKVFPNSPRSKWNPSESSVSVYHSQRQEKMLWPQCQSLARTSFLRVNCGGWRWWVGVPQPWSTATLLLLGRWCHTSCCQRGHEGFLCGPTYAKWFGIGSMLNGASGINSHTKKG